MQCDARSESTCDSLDDCDLKRSLLSVSVSFDENLSIVANLNQLPTDEEIDSLSDGVVSVETPDLASESEAPSSNSGVEQVDIVTSVVIWDWDDTILPTTFLTSLGLSLDGPRAAPETQQLLDVYADCVLQSLKEAEKHGKVVIVTNAETGWIELTSAKFLPSLTEHLNNIPILSARSTFEPQGFLRPYDWKERAFKMVIDNHIVRDHIHQRDELSVWSIGDSMHERDALITVCSSIGIIYKSIKLMERPDLQVLYRQHILIQKSLKDVASKQGPIDVRVQLADNHNNAPIA